VITVYYLL